MGQWLVTFLFYTLPWWAQVAILGAIIGVPVYLIACMLFGTKVANRYILHGVLAIVTLGAASYLRQQGYKRREEEEARARDRAEQIADEERDKAQQLPDDKLNQKVDKWTRD
jgi:type VI protein secretion system component VasK